MEKRSIITAFCERLDKIGITVKLGGNFPWVYLEEVNGKRVKGKFQANHGFTAFWYKMDGTIEFSDSRRVFQKVRETLCS